MADEFMVGMGFFSGAGFLWLVFGGIYKTASFEDQLGFPGGGGHPTPQIGIPPEVGVFLADLFMALMLLGPLVFWVVVPLSKWAVVKKRRRRKKAEAEAE